MTTRDLYDAALIEINKLEAPSMLLEDYNYFINKAIQQYINKAYNRYEINQQATDDLLALKVSKSIDVETVDNPVFPGENKHYYVPLPEQYWHMLSCTITFKVPGGSTKCGSMKDTYTTTVARKMTSDIMPSVINNAYFKPSYRSPYYTVLNGETQSSILDKLIYGEGASCDSIPDSVNGVMLSLMVGNSKYVPTKVHVNYLKTPEKIELTDDDLYGEYNEKQMEFPDYVCYEIINEFVKLLLENASDPRLQTNIPINQTIISPVSE